MQGAVQPGRRMVTTVSSQQCWRSYRKFRYIAVSGFRYIASNVFCRASPGIPVFFFVTIGTERKLGCIEISKSYRYIDISIYRTFGTYSNMELSIYRYIELSVYIAIWNFRHIEISKYRYIISNVFCRPSPGIPVFFYV